VVDQLAEGGDTSAALAAHLAIHDHELGDRHGRLAARRAQQQVARHRARDAHGMPGIAHAGRSTGRQHA
jgi:hypothetical protein